MNNNTLQSAIRRNHEWLIVMSTENGVLMTAPSDTPRLYNAVYLDPEELNSLGENGIIDHAVDNTGRIVPDGPNFISRIGTNLTGTIITVRR